MSMLRAECMFQWTTAFNLIIFRLYFFNEIKKKKTNIRITSTTFYDTKSALSTQIGVGVESRLNRIKSETQITETI